MASEATLDRLFAEFDSPPETVRTVVGLLEENASPAFLARYRRWAIGGLPEERIQAIADRLHALEELEQRKTAIQQQAEERGSWTPELEATVRDSVDQDLIDDLYQSMRPRRRGPAMQMEEKGLAPLALAIQHRQLGDKTLQEVATEYLAPEQDLDTVEKVLEGALLILSDRISHDPKTRAKCRDELKRGVLQARAVDPSKGAKKYQDFFDFAEPIQRIPTGRMLALRRAEREKILKLTLTLPDDRHRALLRELHAKDLTDDSPLLDYYHVVFDHAWQALQETCGRDVRRRIKEKADREAVRTYARNLRSQLMAPPLGPKKVLAIRASGKGAWGVLLGEDGSVSEYKTLPLSNDEQREGALTWLAELIANSEPAAIAVPHGRRQAATEKLLTDLRAKAEKLPMVVPVDEAASTIFASGNAGKKAMPGIEVGVRTTVSLGRRLQDPLIELVRMDVRALGLGHVDDVHQGMLQRELSHTVSSCLAAVGIDLNLCDKDLLQQLPGVSAEQAAATLEHRRKNGGFKTRMQLLDVEGLDPVTVRNILGFLRLTGGDEPLDETGIHPDDYPLVQAVAEKRGKAPRELVGENLRDVPAADFVTEDVTKERVIGVLQQLSREAEDPRGRLVATHNEGLHTFADLRLDSELKGRVTSLTEFGAFIDLGIGQDGLVHISQIPGNRLRDADNTLRVGEVVTVWVLNIDQEKKKISLAMMKPRHIQEGRLATIGERMALQSGRRQRRGPGGEGGGHGDGHQGRGGHGHGRGGEGRGGDGRGRGGPRRRGPGEGGREGGRDGGRFGGGDGGRFGGGGRGRGPRDRGPQRQRVYTVEPGQEVAAGPNSKGEVTSLGNLSALFGGRGSGSGGSGGGGSGGGSGGTGGSGVGKAAKDQAGSPGEKAAQKPVEQAAPPVSNEPPAAPPTPTPAPSDHPAPSPEGESKSGDQA